MDDATIGETMLVYVVLHDFVVLMRVNANVWVF
jgi:hypothetical protein